MNWLGGAGGEPCRIQPDPAGNWRVLPPAGKLFRVGDTGSPDIAADNDSLFVSGQVEVGGGASLLRGLQAIGHHSVLKLRHQSEEMVIAVGQGFAGVDTVTNWFEANSLIFAVSARVTQAPGGGVTTWKMHRKTGTQGEFANAMAVALGTTSVWFTDFPALQDKLIFQDSADKMQIKTNANVTGSDMKIRFEFFFWENEPPTA